MPMHYASFMYSNESLFNIAHFLLKPNVGQKYLKEMILNGAKFNECPRNFKEELLRRKIKIISYWDKRYPSLLKEIPDSPVLLFSKGDISLLDRCFITIIGSRKISQYSMDILEKFFKNFNKFPKDICFVSGLANGVDSEVHRQCLKRNLDTIGVVAGGMDRVYYRGNSVMYQYLCKYRLVISEFPPGRAFFKGMFPLRNRILAGFSKKTFVIQAGEKSGAINTASHANNYGRDVFVIPSGLFSKENRGCLDLASQGAGIIREIDDFAKLIV